MSTSVLTPVDFFYRTVGLLLDENVRGELSVRDVLQLRIPCCSTYENYALAANFFAKNIEEIKLCVDSDPLIAEDVGLAVDDVLSKYEGVFLGDVSSMSIEKFRDEYVNEEELSLLLSLRHMFVGINRKYDVVVEGIDQLSSEISSFIDRIDLGVGQGFQRRISNDLGWISVALKWIKILGIEPLLDALSRLYFNLARFENECEGDRDREVRGFSHAFGRRAVQILEEVSRFESGHLTNGVFSNLLPKGQ